VLFVLLKDPIFFVTVCKTNSVWTLKQTTVEAGIVRGVKRTEGFRSGSDTRYESLEKRRGWLFLGIDSGEKV